MLRLCTLGVLCTILFAGGVNSNPLTQNEGESFPIFVPTLHGHDIKTCILKTPQNTIFEFKPRDGSVTTNNKYEIISNGPADMDCFVIVHFVDIKDEGVWVLTYDHDDANSRSINLTVIVAETATEPEVDEDEGITLLSTIRHATRTEMLIDISLDKKTFVEECYIQPPDGELTKVENFKMENVTVQKSSKYVSCRITLGPMSQSLLGVWRLCGKSKQNHEMRCQPADVIWNTNARPDTEWPATSQTIFSHPVHYGGSVYSGVSHYGNVETCSVITPNGENLVITNDVTYPHIERIASNNPNLCNINFTNIDSTSIGEWAINGKFRLILGGLNEVHLPLRFFLYNEERPYDQAYNITTLPEDRFLVILGRTLEISVKSFGEVDNCQYTMPTGQSYDLNNVIGPNGIALKSVDTTAACKITLSPITEDMIGEWTLIGKFSNGHQFSERRQTFHVIREDPANPIIDEFRVVENLTELIFDSELGASHRITITNANRIENESCHLLTPDGLQYAFMDGFHIPNVEILEENGVECGVTVNVESLDMLGEWTLIARATRTSPVAQIERRRSFTIRIEEHSSLGNAITIAEGADLYLSLPNATSVYHTCKLYGPDDEEVTDFQIDQFRYSSCGFIVRNVTHTQHGTWTIVYGTQIIYRASVEVNILESVEISVNNMVWTAGNSVNMPIGPEDAVYCRLVDNDFNIIFDGFGPCKIELDSVTMAHKGRWRISVGVPGTVMLRENTFDVNVLAADTRPVVSTHVTTNGSSVILTCSVPVENEVQACLFRDPTGTVLIASHGVGQDGFSGAVIRYESDSESHDCTLRLLAPTALQQGMWRCAVNTEHHTSYAFLGVTSSMMDPTDTYRSIEPVLSSSDLSYTGPDGDAVTMSCSIDSAIRYCYFRAPNGTVFNVAPLISSQVYAYVGNGFDAGECGIRFNNLWRNDSGEWSCNVGVGGDREELSRGFDVSIYERMWIWHGWEGSSVSLRFSLGNGPRLEYCRFVRIDGLGFTSNNVPYDYYLDSLELTSGTCSLSIANPIHQDLAPWTVFAKAYGKDGELSMTSTFMSPVQYMSQKPVLIEILLWTFFGILCLLLVLAAVSLIPKRNREWTYKRASILRDSFRKKPLPKTTHTEMPY